MKAKRAKAKPSKKEQQLQIRLIELFNEHYYKITLPTGLTDYFVSVTTKLDVVSSPYLARWRGDVGNDVADRKMENARDRGSRVHKAFEVHCKNGAVIYNDFRNPTRTSQELENIRIANNLQPNEFFVLENQEEAYTFAKLETWLDRLNPKILEAERIVFSTRYREAGTCDGIFHIKGGKYSVNGATDLDLKEGNYVIDIKTGRSISDSNKLQISAYYSFIKEMNLYDLEGAIIVHTSSKNRKGIEGIGTLVYMKEELEANYKIFRHAAEIWDWQNKESVYFKPSVMELPTVYSKRALKGL